VAQPLYAVLRESDVHHCCFHIPTQDAPGHAKGCIFFEYFQLRNDSSSWGVIGILEYGMEVIKEGIYSRHVVGLLGNYHEIIEVNVSKM